MKKIIAFGIVGGVASVVGCLCGAAFGRLSRKNLEKKLSNRDKEIDYMKKQVDNFRYHLDCRKNSEVSIEEIIRLADDAFEWFDYEGCALHLEDEE